MKKTQLNNQKIIKVLKEILNNEDLLKLSKTTNYSVHTVRMVAFGYQNTTERNETIISEAVKLTKKKLRYNTSLVLPVRMIPILSWGRILPPFQLF